MAKAALNMLTRTSAKEMLESGILMSAVDTGWITDELLDGIAAAAPEGPFDLVTLQIGVNDQFRGKTPLILQLTPGQYSIQFVPEVNTYRSCTEQIVVLEARTTTLHKTLEVGFGTLSVRTTPDNANIFLSSTYYGLNKRFYGRSSTKLRNLPAGLYRLQLELDDYRTESLDLIIGDEETTEVELHLVRDRRSLKYGLLGGAGLTLVASVGMGYWAIPRAYSTHEEAEERYAEYRERELKNPVRVIERGDASGSNDAGKGRQYSIYKQAHLIYA